MLTHERNMATLSEIEEKWSIMDLLDANVALDLVDELQRKSSEHSGRKQERAQPSARRRHPR